MADHQKSPSGPREVITQIHPHDVVSGRGNENKANVHPGNVHFRNLVRRHKLEYVSSLKRDKPEFAKAIVHEIINKNPPGRFLKQDKATGNWYDIGYKQALTKTRQALREGASLIKRNRKEKIAAEETQQRQQQLQQHQYQYPPQFQDQRQFQHRHQYQHHQYQHHHQHQDNLHPLLHSTNGVSQSMHVFIGAAQDFKNFHVLIFAFRLCKSNRLVQLVKIIFLDPISYRRSTFNNNRNRNSCHNIPLSCHHMSRQETIKGMG